MSWRQAQFKGKKVWVRVTSDGEPEVQGGRVPMRYSDKPGSKVYRGGKSGVSGVSGPVVDLDAGTPASAGSSKKGSGFGSAGKRTAAQAQRAAQAAEDLLQSLGSDTVVAFTDGGCKGNPGPAGSGAALTFPDGRRIEASLSLGRATNNIAELTAIQMVLELLTEEGVEASAPVAILTDSKYVFGVLQSGWKAKANRELILELRETLSTRPGVALHWVAGHVGVGGNEKADTLANLGVAGESFTRRYPA